jgi:hypothetical protein
VITGASLSHRQLDARQRACQAANIIDGLVMFIPTRRQVADALNVSPAYIAIAQKLSPSQRIAILRGWDPVSFTELMNRPRQLSLAGPVIPDMKVITDADLENMVRNAGIERVLEAAVQVERN